MRVGRDSGAAPDTRRLIGRHTPMANDTTAFALCLCVYRRLSRFERLIHPSAWKRNSTKFAVAIYSSTRLQPLDNIPWCRPPAPKRSDLVAVVAPMCIKGLRLVTIQLPEKFSPIGVGTNRSSHIRRSRKYAQLRSYIGRYSYVQDREMLLFVHKNIIIHSHSIMVPSRGRLL